MNPVCPMCGAAVAFDTSLCSKCGEATGVTTVELADQARKVWSRFQFDLKLTSVFWVLIGFISTIMGCGFTAAAAFGGSSDIDPIWRLFCGIAFFCMGVSGVGMASSGLAVLAGQRAGIELAYRCNIILVVSSVMTLNILMGLLVIPTLLKTVAVRRQARRFQNCGISPTTKTSEIERRLTQVPGFAKTVDQAQFDEA